MCVGGRERGREKLGGLNVISCHAETNIILKIEKNWQVKFEGMKLECSKWRVRFFENRKEKTGKTFPFLLNFYSQI